MSKLLPNTFQHHNFYVDQLAYYLTPEEEKVLNRAIREILGWQDRIESRSARIAVSVFVEGRFKKGLPKIEENRLSMGCGLNEDTVRKCLKSLSEFKILIRTGNVTQEGELYTLQIEADLINWEALKKRRQERDQKGKERIQMARESRTPLVSQDPPCVTRPPLSDKETPVLSDKGAGVLSHKTQKRQSKTNSKPNNNGAPAPLEEKGIKTLIKERFLELTQLPEPGLKKEQKYWWSQFGELAKMFEEFDTDAALEGIERVIKYMNNEELAITGPQSIIKLSRRYVAQQKQKTNQPLPEGIEESNYLELLEESRQAQAYSRQQIDNQFNH